MVTGFSVKQANLVSVKTMTSLQIVLSCFVLILLPPFSALWAVQEITWAAEKGLSVLCATPCQHKF